jgi:hypothetical protein
LRKPGLPLPDRRAQAWSALNISYRGEKGKTTGYYVPNGAEQATREGVADWQKLQECLRELAELNKERNLRHVREPIRDEAMVLLPLGLLGSRLSTKPV